MIFEQWGYGNLIKYCSKRIAWASKRKDSIPFLNKDSEIKASKNIYIPNGDRITDTSTWEKRMKDCRFEIGILKFPI